MPPLLLHPLDIFAEVPSNMLATPAFGLDSFLPQKEAQKSSSGQHTAHIEHNTAGQIHFTTQSFDSIKVTDIQWTPAEDFELLDPTAFTGISSNFVIEGKLDSHIMGLGKSLPMRTKTHNFIHTPETGHINRLIAGQHIRMLLIDLDKDYFLSAIGQQDRWSELVASNMETNRPFAGLNGAATITPAMGMIIDSIIHFKGTGPMRNLLIQNKVLEQLALQLEQFKNADIVNSDIAQSDVEKLHVLKNYLDSHCLEDHSLASLSRYCGLNEFKVKKGFKQLFNSTVFDYLRSRRMEYAAQLLRDQSLLIEEIALRVGYEHSHHFAAAFKKYTGLLPSQFKNAGTGHLTRFTDFK
jgi:AraC family transcriptional activator of pyochelin receptor